MDEQHHLMKDYNWTPHFEMASKHWHRILDEVVLAVHHVGGTATPAIYARPTMDLLLEVTSLASIDASTEHLQKLGYTALGENGVQARRVFIRGEAQLSHVVYMYEPGHPHIAQMLHFRDYMLENPDFASGISTMKLLTAQVYGVDSAPYKQKKHEAFQGVAKLAGDDLAAPWDWVDQREPGDTKFGTDAWPIVNRPYEDNTKPKTDGTKRVKYEKRSQEEQQEIEQTLLEEDGWAALEEALGNNTPVQLILSDKKGRWIGEIRGSLQWDWLEVDSIWVEEAHLNKHLEQQLLYGLEKNAIRQGATRALIHTSSFAMRMFCERQGYSVVGEIVDYPPGTSSYTLMKQLC